MMQQRLITSQTCLPTLHAAMLHHSAGENLQRLLTCVDAVAALLAKIEEVRTQSGVLLANLVRLRSCLRQAAASWSSRADVQHACGFALPAGARARVAPAPAHLT